MIIRNVTNSTGASEREACFEAVAEQGSVQGSCTVMSMDCTRLFPNRAHQIRIDFDGTAEARSTLTGAALAKAIEFAEMKGEPARIYAPCDPEDEDALEFLSVFDFVDDDGVVRMVRKVEPMPERPALPRDMVASRVNVLERPELQKAFNLYVSLMEPEYTRDKGENWPEKLGFVCYTIKDNEGPVGTVLLRVQGNVGAIVCIRPRDDRLAEVKGYLRRVALRILEREGAEYISPSVSEPAEGVVVLRDELSDPREERYFCNRYTYLVGGKNPLSTVRGWTKQGYFRRYLLIDGEGLLGEVLASSIDVQDKSGRVRTFGRIHFIQVNAQGAGRGYGKYLMKLALHMLTMEGADYVECDAHVRISGIMRFLGKFGFEQHELVKKYPGVNWDPDVEHDLLHKRISGAPQDEEYEERPEAPKIEKNRKAIVQDTSEWD